MFVLMVIMGCILTVLGLLCLPYWFTPFPYIILGIGALMFYFAARIRRSDKEVWGQQGEKGPRGRP